MSIGKNILDLRKANKITQEELADKLGVSKQSISKWENDICLPDVSLFPLIAKLFNVSIDRIFGYHIESYDDEVDKIIDQLNDLGGSYKEVEFLTDALTKYPNSSKIKLNLGFAYSNIRRIGKTDEERNNAVEKAISLCNEIISMSFNEKELDGAYSLLASVYSETRDFVKAEDAAGHISSSSFNLRIMNMAQIYAESKNHQNLNVYIQKNLFYLFLAMDIANNMYIQSLISQNKADEALKYCGLQKKILSLFDEGGYGFYACHKMSLNWIEADLYKKADRREECFQSLQEFAQHTLEAVDTSSENHHISKRNMFFKDVDESEAFEEYFDKENAIGFANFIFSKFDAYFGDEERYMKLKNSIVLEKSI